MKEDLGLPKRERRHITRPESIPVDRTDAKSMKKELNIWLEGRSCWSHEDWLALLEDLRKKGFSDLIDTAKGQEAIGLYLELHRKEC